MAWIGSIFEEIKSFTVGSIFEGIKSFAVSYINHHRKLEDYMNELHEEVDHLNARKRDRELEIEAEVRRGKRVKVEVENWFKDVEKVCNEVTTIQEKFGSVSFFSRGHLGSSVCQRIEEVNKICQQGNFLNGVAIDGPPDVGVTIPTPNLEGEIHVKEKIWEYLMGDEVGMIGVCGMGGIGKTTIMKHINNRLVKERTKFDHVIWVTISKDLNIFNVQKVIADSLKVSLDEVELCQRANRLKGILERKRYVLILDDVWEQFSLEDVIIEPTLGASKKVILTSRLIDVCNSMDCNVVEVQLLSKVESMNLFLDGVGHSVVQDQNLKSIVNKIVEECRGLPLSIVTTAGSMKGATKVYEWENALNELKECVKSVKGSDIEIYRCLKFSYDHLKNSEFQNCFLYCSLYPEDFVFNEEELIESWIDEGFIDGLETIRALHFRGYNILKKLENNCLLERVEYGVKMHDVLRDMALYIRGHHFMVKAGMQLTEVPDEQAWTVEVEMVSLMRNQILEIPPQISPKCLHLSTLILRECGLRSIPESFFIHMPELKVLDLSFNTEIEDLPKSISNLVNLKVLRLHGCMMLKYVPSLVNLKTLRKLDLGQTAIEEVPHGIEMLKNLRYLRLRSRHIKELPLGMLSMIPHIQCLILEGAYVMGEEVRKLRKLEYVQCSFCDVKEFKKYVESIQGKWPTYFNFQVGRSDISFWLDPPNFKNIFKAVIFWNCEMDRCDDEMVPSDLDTLEIDYCEDFKCLSNVLLFRKATELKQCRIDGCSGMECMVDVSSSSSCKALHTIEELCLWELDNLQEIVRVRVGVELESTSHDPSPLPLFFSSLKRLELVNCPRVKKLFPVELLQGLQNLEIIHVEYCSEMEEIIASEQNHKGEGTTFILPKLKSLKLLFLPKLKSICGGGVMIPADHLESLVIARCPEVKRMPLCLPLDENGQPSPPPSLHYIRVHPPELWESIEWDQPHAKHLLSPFVHV